MEPELKLASGLTLEQPAGLPDLSLPALSGGTPAVPPIVAAVNPGAGAQAGPPEVRLASPASVGKGLRDDDVAGVYLAVGGIAALVTLAAFVLAAGGRAAAPATSVLKLPNA